MNFPLNMVYHNTILHAYIVRGLFQVCTQPMRDAVTEQHRLTLAGCKPRISPVVTMSSAEKGSDQELTKYTPYLLWVFCEYFGENQVMWEGLYFVIEVNFLHIQFQLC